MDINISLYFDCTNKTTFVKDNSEYNLPTGATVSGLGSLVNPSGLLVFSATSPSTPLIDPDADPRVSSEVSLGGTIRSGEYKFSFSNYYEYQNSIAGSDFVTFSGVSQIKVAGVDLSGILNSGVPITIANATDAGNNGTYTVSSVVYNSALNFTTINISETTLTPNAVADEVAVLTFNNTVEIYNEASRTYSSCGTLPTPCITFAYDCFSTSYGSATITDSTNYTGFTRESVVLTAYFPNALNPAPTTNPVVNTTGVININTLATGTWTNKLVTTVSDVQTDGLVLQNTLTKFEDAVVMCDSSMCSLGPCLTKLKDKHISYLKSSQISPLQQYVDNVQLLYTLAKEAQACGDKDAYSGYVADIYDVLDQADNATDCGCGCGGACSDGCNDNGPEWVNNIGTDINSLLAEFETFMTDTLPGIESSIETLTTTTESLSTSVETLNSEVATLATQTSTNTGDITTLESNITAIESDITTIQTDITNIEEQLATLSPSDSEIVKNEVSFKTPLAWEAISGDSDSSVSYTITASGDLTSSISTTDIISFYNTPINAWFVGRVTSITYSSGSNTTSIVLDYYLTTFDGAAWETYTEPFPFYLTSGYTTSDADFRINFDLDNADYWKFNDATNKYWSEVNVKLVCNDETPITVYNSTANKTITIRSNPGSLIDVKFVFEKLYNGSTYDTSILCYVEHGTGRNVAVSEGATYDGGWTGFVPIANSGYITDGVTPVWNIPTSKTDAGASANSTQNIYDYTGVFNTNKSMFRYDVGANFPGNSAAQFFTANVLNSIVFNSGNANISVWKFEQSYGKTPTV